MIDVITDVDFSGDLTVRTSDNVKSKIKVKFKFGTLNHDGQTIEFTGTRGKIFHETLLKSMCEVGLQVIKQQ